MNLKEIPNIDVTMLVDLDADGVDGTTYLRLYAEPEELIYWYFMQLQEDDSAIFINITDTTAFRILEDAFNLEKNDQTTNGTVAA